MSAGSFPTARAPFSVMAKPIGPACNLNCSYCYYVRKEELYDPDNPRSRMQDDKLEAYIKDYIHANPAPTVTFAWQGGEPTLLGIDWFRKAVDLQKKHCPPGKQIDNALQTNGTLLNEDWCSFLRDNRFLVGISIDGPEEIHDSYRVDKGEKPTFARVMHGIELLRRHKVEFNTLTTVHRKNQKLGREVYQFLIKEAGSRHIQFIPIVERRLLQDGKDAGPAKLDQLETRAVYIAPETVGPSAYGDFLIEIFDVWIRRDVGRVFVYAFEQVLSKMLTGHSGICVHEETCGDEVVIERDGSVYSCDHYVYPEFKLGEIGEQGMADMLNAPRQRQFGNDKRDKLPNQCKTCPVLKYCNGGCPKHRFSVTRDGQPGLNYLCGSYYHFFTHVEGPLGEIAELIRAGKDPALITKKRRR